MAGLVRLAGLRDDTGIGRALVRAVEVVDAADRWQEHRRRARAGALDGDKPVIALKLFCRLFDLPIQIRDGLRRRKRLIAEPGRIAS